MWSLIIFQLSEHSGGTRWHTICIMHIKPLTCPEVCGHQTYWHWFVAITAFTLGRRLSASLCYLVKVTQTFVALATSSGYLWEMDFLLYPHAAGVFCQLDVHRRLASWEASECISFLNHLWRLLLKPWFLQITALLGCSYPAKGISFHSLVSRT